MTAPDAGEFDKRGRRVRFPYYHNNGAPIAVGRRGFKNQRKLAKAASKKFLRQARLAGAKREGAGK